MGDRKQWIKSKNDRLMEPLYIRWIEGDYRYFLKKLKDTKSLSKKHPKIYNMYDLRNINLRKTKLDHIDLENACFNDALAYDVIISSCSFRNSEFFNSDFVQAKIRDTNFLNCNFDDANFEASVISGTNMLGCNLSNCNFQHSEFINFDVSDCNLDNSNFSYLKNYDENAIIGAPKSMKDVIIDRYTFLHLKNKSIKKLIFEQGKIIDTSSKYQYDVALSFAGEKRNYVEQVAKYLKEHYIKVFYDDFEKANLWGKDLITHLTALYNKQAKYVIVFNSEEYERKAWTNVERIAALSRMLNGEYDNILPVMFDNTEIKGLTNTKAFLRGDKLSPNEVAECFIDKLLEDLG